VKPAAFAYERPDTMASALALAAADAGQINFIAGGQSLGPMLNLRLVQPDLLIDVTRIPDLKQIEETGDNLIVGACITHADIEDGRVPDVTRGAMPSVARNIAYRAVRNRGTIGGSLTHADPAGDWLSALCAIGASAIIHGSLGRREIPVENFMLGMFQNALGAGEILQALRIPRLSSSARWGYYKVCRKTGEFAHAIGAVLLDPARGVSRAVIGATGGAPIVWTNAAVLLDGNFYRNPTASFDSDGVRTRLAAAGISDAISQQIHLTAFRRAVAQAMSS
jgi:aerobic carbon-monoxide dehydrogenase medium subunit